MKDADDVGEGKKTSVNYRHSVVNQVSRSLAVFCTLVVVAFRHLTSASQCNQRTEYIAFISRHLGASIKPTKSMPSGSQHVMLKVT